MDMKNKNLSIPKDWDAAIQEAADDEDISYSRFVLEACAARMTDPQKRNLSKLVEIPRPGRKSAPPVGRPPV